MGSWEIRPKWHVNGMMQKLGDIFRSLLCLIFWVSRISNFWYFDRLPWEITGFQVEMYHRTKWAMASAEEGGPRGILVVQRRGSSRERWRGRKS